MEGTGAPPISALKNSKGAICEIKPQIREVALAGYPCPHTAGHLLSTLLLMGY
jgi:hypothetical protein